MFNPIFFGFPGVYHKGMYGIGIGPLECWQCQLFFHEDCVKGSTVQSSKGLGRCRLYAAQEELLVGDCPEFPANTPACIHFYLNQETEG